MTGTLVTFLLGALAIIVAGVLLTRSADAIAERTGLGRLLVGSILLAGATSLPELNVDISAIRLGQPNLAVGNVLGSCLFNLLILAALDLTRFSRGRMLSHAASGHALSAMMTILLCATAVLAILNRPAWTLPIAGDLGAGALALLVLYLGGYRIVYFDQRLAAQAATRSAEAAMLDPASTTIPLGRAVVGFALAAAVIVAVSPSFARAADTIAERTGLGRSFVGTTLVALCTTLPETVASLAALRMGAADLALGNVFGSNAFNLAILGLLDLFQAGPLLSQVDAVHAQTGVCIILATAITVIGQLYRVESRTPVLEPDGWLVVGIVLGALYLVYRAG